MHNQMNFCLKFYFFTQTTNTPNQKRGNLCAFSHNDSNDKELNIPLNTKEQQNTKKGFIKLFTTTILDYCKHI